LVPRSLVGSDLRTKQESSRRPPALQWQRTDPHTASNRSATVTSADLPDAVHGLCSREPLE
jgi:hypothetical protein